MNVHVDSGCGLDVHAAVIVACLLVGPAGRKPHKEIRKVGTTTRDLEGLRTWLKQAGCTHVAMESTGVYWKPVHAVLESDFTVVVANARHIKHVPGRKTDVKDCEWIAELLRMGLLRSSFVPPPPLRSLRKLLRYRAKLTQTRTAERNRLHGVLHAANIQLANVASDVFGASGKLMLHALIDGHASPEDMASLAKGRLRDKHEALVLALEGRLDDDDRFLLKLQLDRIQRIDVDIEALDARIDEQLQPYAAIHRRLCQIPGVDRITAAVIIAELGVDMSVFLSAWHAAAWAGVCPANNQSAGRRREGPTRKGNPHLRTALVQAATAASRTRGTYLKDKYHRLRARRGPKRAALAVGHKILIAAYHIIQRGADYRDLGDSYLDNLSRQRTTRGLVKRLTRMGYTVELRETPPEPAGPKEVPSAN